MPTPHNSANPGDFAKTVLMPGDPLRAKFIADTFLDNARLVNNVRGIHGYTGTYKDVPVSFVGRFLFPQLPADQAPRACIKIASASVGSPFFRA